MREIEQLCKQNWSVPACAGSPQYSTSTIAPKSRDTRVTLRTTSMAVPSRRQDASAAWKRDRSNPVLIPTEMRAILRQLD